MPSNPNNSGRQARHWLLTLHQPDWSPPSEQLPQHMVWLRGQKEIGSNTGAVHWQLFASYDRPVRLAKLKKDFGNTVHAEPSRSEAAAHYVWKEDTAIAGKFDFSKIDLT